jgi:hypothetical protein
VSLFQNINDLGNYSDPNWFLSLDKRKMIIFMNELLDIWRYRAQISNEMKLRICPPHGNPFRNFSLSHIINDNDIESIRRKIIDVLETMINNEIVTNDNKSLAAYYILGALTIVSMQAAIALPWLHQSMV